jgi:hypothetical protein
MNRSIRMLGFAVVAASAVMAGCYGTGSAYVGVYGPPVYGPGPWGGYPYPGRYPPYGGGVWVGVPICCDEQEEQQPEAPQDGQGEAPQQAQDDASEERGEVPGGQPEPTITIQENIER